MAVDMNKLVNLDRLKEFQTSENDSTASEFSTSKSYAAGAYVYYKGKLYKFKSAHAAGAWTTTDVEEAKLADDVSNLKESIANNPFQITKPDTSLLNYYVRGSDGVLISTEGSWKATSYIFIPCKTIQLNSTIYGNGGLAFYDFNKTFISGIDGNNASEYGFTPNLTATERTVNVPENAYYIRASIYTNYSTDFYIKGVINPIELIEQLSNAKQLNTTSSLALSLSN